MSRTTTTRSRIASITAGCALAAGFALLPLTAAQASPGQTVTPNDDATALAAALAGPGITVSNADFTGDELAAGTFSGFGGSVGIDSGVVLSSGDVSQSIVGPNSSTEISTEFGTAGDADLDAIVAPDTTNDAAVLEFDFVPDAANIQFTYVFGSDEYNEYVGQYNDVFALYVNGENCALIGSTPVSIDNVNAELNAQYYVNNDPDVVGSPTPFDTELDGYTVPLTCSAAVAEGEVNHLKLAVADTVDEQLDSVVMIQAGSIAVNNPPVANDQVVATTVDTPVAITLSATDPDGDPITATNVESLPTHGTLSGLDAELVYTPNPGYTGTDSFTFVVTDGVLVSAPATVLITVNPPAAVTVAASGPTASTLAATGVDAPWAPLTAAALALFAGSGAALFSRRRPAHR